MDQVNNQKYSNHRVVMGRVEHALSQLSLGSALSEDDIIEWCAECETDYIADYNFFVPFRQVGVKVERNVAKLPCNIYRIEDVYAQGGVRVSYYNDGSYLDLGRNFRGNVVFLNYLGVPVDKEGIPLVGKGHEQACTTFCIMQSLLPFHIAGTLKNPMIYAEYEDRLNYQCIASRNGYRHKDRNELNKMDIIFGNMIPKIGSLQLVHEAFIDRGMGGIS